MDELKPLVRGMYDVQKMRIQAGNRIVANFRVKLGQDPGKHTDTLDAEGKKLLKSIKNEYERITDGVIRVTTKRIKMMGGIISNYTAFALVGYYVSMLAQEEDLYKNLKAALKDYEIYNAFLKDIKGVGPSMAGVIISEIDIAKARYPSSLWRYAGLDVAGDGRGRSRRREHLVDIEYTDREGKTQTRKGITFNPFLKTKLTGVLSGSFFKSKNDTYCPIFHEYKHRLENHAVYKDVRPIQRYRMAVRYMIKRFLVDLYVAWRPLEGLPVADEYSVAKLAMKHSA